MVISSEKVAYNRTIQPLDLVIDSKKIVDIVPRGSFPPDRDYGNRIIYPGFIDIHTHGGAMIDVNHVEKKEDIEKLSRFYASHGVTAFLVSVLTDTKETTEKLLATYKENVGQHRDGATLLGVHLEGPFLSLDYKGSMPGNLILSCDATLFDHYQEVSGNTVLYITLAPELEGGIPLIEHIRSKGNCVVSLGHSASDYEMACEAIDKGATSITHIFNAQKLFHMHYPAISGAGLERDDVYVEMICDGFHLHPATIRLLLKCKGLEKVVAISDSIMAAGMPDGRYILGVNPVIVKDGDAKLITGVRAGSTLTLDKALRNIEEFSDFPIEKLTGVVSGNAAKLLGLGDRGEIGIGKFADLVILDEQHAVEETLVEGKIVYRR